MSEKTAIIGRITEGGQLWFHRIRMIKQVVKSAFWMSAGVSAISFVVLVCQIDPLIYQATWYQAKAEYFSDYNNTVEIDTKVWRRLSRENRIPGDVRVSSRRLETLSSPYAGQLWPSLLKATTISLFILLGGWVLLLSAFAIRGGLRHKTKPISGQTLGTAKELNQYLRKNNQVSDLKLGELHLSKDMETCHLLVTGGTGSGKTNCFHHLLPQIRDSKQPAIIVDTTGAFLERYYRPGKDIILDPFHDQSQPWHPWAECRDKNDYNEIAQSFLPESYREEENFWRKSGKTVFSTLLEKMESFKKTSMLTEAILRYPLNRLCELVEGTKAASVLDISSERTASSIRSVAASYLESLEHLQDTDTPFSIRDWMTNPGDSWLFLHTTMQRRASMLPLLSAWFSIACRSLFRLQPDHARRMWFVVDELPSLHRLPALETFLVESRKFGGCALLALQSLAQLDAIYGRSIRDVITGNCLTKIAFLEQSPKIAQEISLSFGEKELEEYREGLSYGAHEMRDGVNLSQQYRSKPVVSPNDIMSLRPNEAFVKLPGNAPPARIKLTIKQ